MFKDPKGIVPPQRAGKIGGEQIGFVVRTKDGDRIEIALKRRSGKTLQCRFGAKHAGSSSQWRVPLSETAEHPAAHPTWHVAAQLVFVTIEDVSAIPRKVFVASVSTERNGNVFARHL